MTVPYFYIPDSNTPQNDSQWLDAVSSTLSDIVANLGATGTGQLKFVIGWGASVQASYTVDEITLQVSETNDPDVIQVGDDLYEIDTIGDALVAAAITSSALALAGAAAFSVKGMAIAGVVAYVYSEFVDPVTDSILLALGGQDEVHLLNSSGSLEAGMVYDDGIPSTEVMAAHAMISHATANGLSVIGKVIDVKTGVFTGQEFDVRDISILQTLATRLGTSTEAIIDSESNADYFGITAQGTEYMISAESFSYLDQTLNIPLEIEGRTLGVDVEQVYDENGALQWGDSLNAGGGHALHILDSAGGSYAAGVSVQPRLFIGSNSAETATMLNSPISFGSDIFYMLDGNDTVIAGIGDDIIYGDGGEDSLKGGEGNDTILGGIGNDTIEGGEGENLLEGGDGIDFIYSHLSSSSNSDDASTLYGGMGNDSLYSGDGADVIYGGGGNDQIFIAADNDSVVTVYGGEGDDIIHLKKTQDVYIHDSDGKFTISFSDHVVSDSYFSPASPGNYPSSYFMFSSDTYWDFTGLEELNVEGNWINGTLTWGFPYGNPNNIDYGTITIANNAVIEDGDMSDAGGNIIFSHTPASSNFDDNASDQLGSIISSGTSADDNLIGDSEDNSLSGVGGNDTINAGGGDDTVDGGSGDDTLNAGSGNDIITGGSNEDTLDGGVGDDTLDGGAAQDTITTGGGNDTIIFTSTMHSVRTGQNYDNITDFEVGADIIDVSGLGFDSLVFNTTSTELHELRVTLNSSGSRTYIRNNQTDFEFYLDGDYTETVANGGNGILTEADFTLSAPQIDIVKGTDVSDTLTGGAGRDYVLGFGGKDHLYGLGGNDTLDGGLSEDSLLEGGSGADLFRFRSLVDSIVTGDKQDTITDFQPGIDKIDLSGLGYHSLVNSSTSSGEVRLAYSSGSDRTFIRNEQSTFEVVLNGDYTNLITEDDIIFGDQDNQILGNHSVADTLTGTSGNDALHGFKLDDTLLGMDGDDMLDGGEGQDDMTGGNGADLFRFTHVDDTIHINSTTMDKVTDFELGTDQLDLAALGITDITIGNGSANGSTDVVEVYYSSNSNRTYVRQNDGDSSTDDFAFYLVNNYVDPNEQNYQGTLSVDDFVLI